MPKIQERVGKTNKTKNYASKKSMDKHQLVQYHS